MAHRSQDRDLLDYKSYTQLKSLQPIRYNNYRHYGWNERTDLRLTKEALSMSVKEQAADAVCVCV